MYCERAESRSGRTYLVPFDADPAAFRTHVVAGIAPVVVVVVVDVVLCVCGGAGAAIEKWAGFIYLLGTKEQPKRADDIIS